MSGFVPAVGQATAPPTGAVCPESHRLLTGASPVVITTRRSRKGSKKEGAELVMRNEGHGSGEDPGQQP